jgi:hypothetical protein
MSTSEGSSATISVVASRTENSIRTWNFWARSYRISATTTPRRSSFRRTNLLSDPFFPGEALAEPDPYIKKPNASYSYEKRRFLYSAKKELSHVFHMRQLFILKK